MIQKSFPSKKRSLSLHTIYSNTQHFTTLGWYFRILLWKSYEEVLISSQPDLLPNVIGRNRQCHWKEGSVLCRNASLFLLQRLKGSMSGDTSYFNNIEMLALIKIFSFLYGKASKEIQAILIETLGQDAPSYASVKNWVAHFKHGDFSTCNAPLPG